MFDVIYKTDTMGKIRTFSVERDGHRYRTLTGVEGGKLVEGKWVEAKPKNVGKQNYTTPEQQAIKEVEAKYVLKLRTGYTEERGGTPAFLPPMLAQTFDPEKHIFNHVFVQPKLDGIRCIYHEGKLWTRTGEPLLGFDHLLEELDHIAQGLSLDGELYDHSKADKFNELLSDIKNARRNIQFHVYDVPYSKLVYAQRRELLATLGESLEFCQYIKLVPTLELWGNIGGFKSVQDTFLSQKYEGVIIRTPDGLYESGKRSKNLLKLKDFTDEEFPVLAVRAGEYDSVVFTCQAHTNTFEASLGGNREDIQHYLTGPLPKELTVQYFGFFPSGKPRFPVAKVVHMEGRNN